MTFPIDPHMVPLSPDDSMESVIAKAVGVRPSPRQLAWQHQEVSCFIHFGMNTFTDREWGDGKEDPALFNPSALDAGQWVRAAKAAGMTKMILTAKHHDGFCLWPSRFTSHSVKHSPWKSGRGDVVGEFVAACRSVGMRYGIYISPWDRHEPSYGDSPAYNTYFLNQLREVLTNYPGIEEVWFDGACAEGPNGRKQEYDWRAYWALIRSLAPNASIAVRGPDVRWCGNEAGHSRSSEWSVIPLAGDGTSWEESDTTLDGYLHDIHGSDLGSRDILMRSRRSRARLAWYPSQVNTSIRPGWFYHAHEDNRVRSLTELLEIYYGSVGGNGQFLLNVPPDRRGLFHEHDVSRLKQFGDVLAATFRRDLIDGAGVDATVAGGTGVGSVQALLDRNPATFWTTTDGSGEVLITARLPAPVRANCVMLQEHIESGQRVEAFSLEVLEGGSWRSAAGGTVIGYKRLVRFADATITGFRVRLTQFRIRPTLSRLGLYFAPAVLSGPRILRDLQGTVSLVAPSGAAARYTLDGTEPTASSNLYRSPFPLPRGGLILARSFPLTSGSEMFPDEGVVTRVEYGPAKAKWRIHDVDSEDREGGRAEHVIDDDARTFWETRHRDGVDPPPHHISVDMGEIFEVTGFTYTPRQDGWPGGIILSARFDTSLDGSTWTIAVSGVEFDNVVNSRQQQVVRLAAPVSARYFRMTALRTEGDGRRASAADVSVLLR
jgi:alpha-L-fucosidase